MPNFRLLRDSDPDVSKYLPLFLINEKPLNPGWTHRARNTSASGWTSSMPGNSAT